MLFRILTEDVNRAAILETADDSFEAYTSYEAVGSWRGKREASYVLEFALEPTPENRERVRQLALNIKRQNAQEAVLIQEIAEASVLV